MKLVSVICPIYNEERFIEKCIESLLSQDYPKHFTEILLVDGMSTDKTREKITEYIRNYSFIKLIDNPFKIVPNALNIGIKVSKGDVIIRVDAHCEYPINYISTLVKYLFELNADNVGGIWNTLPSGKSLLSKSIAFASSHKFGVGNSSHKTGTSEIKQTDTVPFGCYNREIFDHIGFFDEELIRNQDDEFNARLIKNGGKIFILPQLVINYFARETIKKNSKMYFQYGLFKPLVNKKLHGIATIRQLFPLFFLIFIIGGLILSLFSVIVFYMYIFILLLYLSFAFYFSIIKAIQDKNFNLAFTMPIVFLSIHLSYGLGYLIGIFKIILHSKFKVQINR